MTNSNISIRTLEVQDQEDWRKLWTQYLEFYHSSVDEEVYDRTFQRLIDRDEADCDGHIAFLDGKAVGIVHCIYHIHMWQLGKVCYLQDLFTSADARNKGVARALIETVYRNADKQKISTVYWLTQDFNNSARHLYDKIGKLTPFIKYTRS